MTEIRIQVAEEVDRYLDAAVKNGLFTNKAEIARAALIQYMNSINLMSRNYDDELVFSPEGRIYQLEYARNAVSRGLTSVAVSCSDGVVVCCEKSATQSPMLLRADLKKIFLVGDKVLVAYSGMISDGNLVIEQLKNTKFSNNAQLIEAVNHIYRPYLYDRNRRPLGVGLLIASILEKPTAFYVDPSGGSAEFSAVAMGLGAEEATKVMEKNYKKMTVSRGEEFALEALGEESRKTGSYELKTLRIK
ncbi:MAG: hypothetical protein KIY11_07760 [Thermoplasmata archaeon]|nr:hypothetical protein [Candidatus Sysuiplasma acidicola]